MGMPKRCGQDGLINAHSAAMLVYMLLLVLRLNGLGLTQTANLFGKEECVEEQRNATPGAA